MDRKTPILDMIRQYTKKDAVRFHMPGHKGDGGFFGGELLKGDITELGASDNLHTPRGVIRQSQELHARRTGAAHCFYGVNGSSACVLAMIRAAVAEGEKIVLARDFHVSAAHALMLSGAVPVLVEPAVDGLSGLPGAVSPADVRQALAEHPDAKAVYVTYPNYFGMCADIAGIAAVAHERNVPLLADAAHAAHFSYSPLLPDDCAAAGADVWTVSAHKTLPAMNPCAVLSVGKDSLLDADGVKQCLNLFTTTSPSYLHLASLDYASAYMAERGNYELYRVVSLTEKYMALIGGVRGLSCAGMEMIGRANIHDKDVLKLVVDVSLRNITGEVARRSLEDAGIFIEAADTRHILLIVTVADGESSFDRLYGALKNLPEGIRFSCGFTPYELPEAEFFVSPKEAAWCRICRMPLEQAAGFVCARPAGVYPPGVPCLVPGQMVTREAIDYLEQADAYGFDVFGAEDGRLTVVDQ